MTIDTTTLTAIASTVLLLIGGIVTAAIRWARAKAAIASETANAEAKAAQDAAAATTKAVRDLLTDILGPAQDDADGSGSWPSQSGRWPRARAAAKASAAACTSVDCRTDVLAAVTRLEGKVDKLNEKWETMFNVQRERVEKHRVRIALLEQRAGGRRPSTESDSARPTER